MFITILTTIYAYAKIWMKNTFGLHVTRIVKLFKGEKNVAWKTCTPSVGLATHTPMLSQRVKERRN